MNIDEEYAEKKKEKESQLCQQLISQCKDKQLIYEKGSIFLLEYKLLFFFVHRFRITKTPISTTKR